jgi:hypothetical protein
MVSSGMLRHVALVRTDISAELSSSIRVTRIGEIGTSDSRCEEIPGISSQRSSVAGYS